MSEQQRIGLLWVLHLHLLALWSVPLLLMVLTVLLGVAGLTAFLEWEAGDGSAATADESLDAGRTDDGRAALAALEGGASGVVEPQPNVCGLWRDGGA